MIKICFMVSVVIIWLVNGMVNFFFVNIIGIFIKEEFVVKEFVWYNCFKGEKLVCWNFIRRFMRNGVE